MIANTAHSATQPLNAVEFQPAEPPERLASGKQEVAVRMTEGAPKYRLKNA